MKLLWKITVPVSCAALICAAGISWHFVKARAAQRKLADKVNACRNLAEQGDAKAQSELASRYFYGKGVPQDYTAAATWDRKAADQGYANAQYDLAYLYQTGKGVPQDRSQAITWDRKAADQGYAKAEYAMGYSYYEGWEVPQDYTEAVRWYRKAADQGYAQAQTELGYMYSQGKGVPPDYEQAVQLYRKAADQGYSRAQSALAYAYSAGKGGVPQDYTESARWYLKAAKKGDDYALRALDATNIRLSVVSKILLSVVFLGSVFLLIGSRGSIRAGPHRTLTLAGFFGLLWVALDVYGHSHMGLLLSLSAVNVFFSAKSLLGGIGVAVLLSFGFPHRIRVALGVCGMLFIALNLYATTHYGLRHLSACPRSFFSLNAMLIGTGITLAILLWTTGKEHDADLNGKDVVAP